MTELDTSRISPTAHYTGYVWCRNDLSPPQLATATGRAMFYGLQGPMLAASQLMGGVTLEKMLLVRHLIIDHLLDSAIEQGRVGQVLEIASGISGRGLRLTRRHRDLIYVEGDLPGMVARKRRMLQRCGHRAEQHHIVTLNALAEDGPQSIFAVADELLEDTRGTAIVTEGLLNYFPIRQVQGMWSRFASLASERRQLLHVFDHHFEDEFHGTPISRAFRVLLSVIAGGKTHLHFTSATELDKSLSACGFSDVTVHQAPDHELMLPAKVAAVGDQLKVVEAWTPSTSRLEVQSDA